MESLRPKLRFPEFNGDWEMKKLENIADVKTGPFGSSLHQHDYVDIGTPIITVEHLNELGIVHKNLPLVSDKDKSRLKSYHLKTGDLVFSRVGSVDRCSIISERENGWLFSGRLLRVRFHNQIPAFFNYQFQLETTKQKVRSIAVGQTMPSINTEILKSIELTLASFQEQTKIANFLSAVDEKINLLKEKKSLLEDYKKGIMQKIFKQEIRFKDDNGNDFEDWKTKTLAEVSTKESSNISANKIEDNFGDFIIYGASGILKHVDFYLQENDYISIIKDGAGVGRIFYCEGKTSVLGTMEMIKPIEGINTYFLYCLLNNIDFTAFITGSTIPHIYFKDYSKVKCGIPCYDEQTKIANFLSAIDEKIDLVSIQIEDTQEYKKGLLQQMFI